SCNSRNSRQTTATSVASPSAPPLITDGSLRHEPSWTRPVEWDVLTRIRRPLELVAKRIDGTGSRFAPGHKLSGSGLAARRIHELRIFSRNARWASQGLGPGLYFASNLRPPLSAVGRDLESDPRTLDASDLSALSKQRSDDSRKSSDMAAENAGKNLSLAIVSVVVDEDTGGVHHLSRPQTALPTCHSDETQTIAM